jgi:LuxR family transcriptional regulator of csgAB operon
MQSNNLKSENMKNLAPMAYIHVVGMNKLQNDLLLSFLKEKTGFSGKCIKKLESVTPIQKENHESPQFLLLDWSSFSSENIWIDIESWKNSNSCKCFFAFCNVDPGVEIEKLALRNNIQGLFYKNDPLNIIPKGIFAILNGDLWYSRKTLTKCILDRNPPKDFSEHAAYSNLTIREREVLILMASGCSNKQVATELCISSHTVKTHVYNIYKKINVDSRFQAALWAAKHL